MKRAVVVVALLALFVPSASVGAGPMTVFAAASLSGVLPQIDKAPRYSFLGSDQLALQLQQGAPADVYAAASPKYPELLYHQGVVRKPVTFATNKLVVIVPRSNPAGVHSVFDALGITADVTRNVVSQETDVKGIVAKVALGEADAGFVYVTDAKPVSGKVRVVPLPGWAQPPIRYELAVVKRSTAATAFVKKVLSKRGRTLLQRAGFGVPPLKKK